MQRQNKRIIITQRVWQLIAAIGLVLMALFAGTYPLGFNYGIRLFFGIFLIIFSLTYMREERRATKSARSNLVINWNLAESILLLLSIVVYFVVATIQDFDRNLFYAYFHTGFLGLLCGVTIGELLWQNTTLRKLDDYCRRRYWANYKNSIW